MSATKHHLHNQIEEGMRKIPAPLKESPILFSTPLVQANLEKRKTQTRRLSGLKKVNENPDHWEFKSKWRTINRLFDGTKEESPNPLRRYFVFENKITGQELEIRCPYGDKKGDLIWVREAFSIYRNAFLFKADEPHVFKGIKYKPSIHMPKDFSRIWLEFQDANIQRLQDISETDAKSEGVEPGYLFGFGAIGQSTFREGFFNKWIEINGIENLHENPWVWVVNYKILSTTGKPELV